MDVVGSILGKGKHRIFSDGKSKNAEGFVLMKDGKRLRDKSGELTPWFEYASQADKYVGGSKYVKIQKVK